MPRLRWTLPVASALLDVAVIHLAGGRIATRLIAAATLPAGVFSYGLLREAPLHWIWLHEGMAMLVWWGVGAWADAGRPGARRVCVLYLILRVAASALCVYRAAAGFGALVLGLTWIAAALVLGRQWLARARGF